MSKLNGMESQHAGGVTEGAFSSPLLQTRLHIPPLRAKLVPRPRLAAFIEQALESKLLLLSAPAGYGKTTLLSAWAHESSWPVAWFSLDSADNDRTRFLTYLIHALQHVREQVGKITLDLLTSQQAQSTEMLLIPLVNEFLSAPRMILVLDDYHVIEEQRIHEALLFLLEHLPESLHLIIATRTDPPLPLARLRARHQLRELRTSELRFRREESAAFLTESMDLPLQEETIVMLDERNQGWITGLQLAALSLQGQTQQPIKTLTGIHHFVFDYLAEEVMQHLSAPLQEFLLKTSVLTHLQASLCEAVTGQESSQHQLELLERTNLFLTPLDAERTWYHYHPLFAEFLQKRLNQSAPERIPDLVTRASIWCEQHHYPDEAIQYALAAEQYLRAAQLMAHHARTLLAKRELSTLLHWVEKLPTDIIQTQPQLCIAYCWALLFTFQSERIVPLLQPIQDVLDETPDSEDKVTQQLRGEVAAIQATQASLKGDLKQTIIRSQQALAWLPAEDLWTRGTLVFFQGVAYYVTGNMLKAQHAYQEALSLNRRAGNHALSLLAHCYLARLSVTIGRLQDALRILEAARAQAEQHDRHLSFEGGLLAIELSNIYYQQNEMDAAYTMVTRGIEIGKTLASTGVLRAGYTALARWQQARGRVEEVRSLLWQIDQMKQPASVLWIEAELQAYRLQWEIMQHHETAIERRLAEQEVKEPPISVLTEITYLAQARVLIASAHYDAAFNLLEKLLQHAEDEQRTGSIISITVLQANAFSARGDQVHALKAIQRALSLAAPERYMRVFLDEGEPIKAILQHAMTHSIQSSYVIQLLRAFSEAASRTPHTQPLLDPLSERELEVLQCIMRGQSNQTIADHLQVSLNTVKTHMSHIFAKLHVNSRTQAVARANELQLIEVKRDSLL
ncbi:MAG: LuxR C-terminal-related transcriptional regulator [Chloroflexota bacterium]|nr:LuxR C-terminal-related transcriptional regulator [Chloroflexota bacterium]